MSEIKQARRYSDSKIKHHLIPTSFKEELAKVYTIGADKYTLKSDDGTVIEEGADNWRNQMPWRSILGSIYRHLSKFEIGDDYDYDYPKEQLDKYGPTLHLANAAWGLAALIEHRKIHPEMDDRIKDPSLLRSAMLNRSLQRVYLDLDGVCADFEQHFLQYFNLPLDPPKDWGDVRFVENMHLCTDNDDFWLSIPSMITVDDFVYPIKGYCTARGCSLEVIKKWLALNNLPILDIINVGWGGSKSEALKGKCDLMIDDSITNFMDLNTNKIKCYLFSRPHNLKYDVGHMRIDNVKNLLQTI